MSALLRHPVLWIVLVLVALTGLWQAIGAPISLITQIAIYMLYGAGVNLLVGYTLAWCHSAPRCSSAARPTPWRSPCNVSSATKSRHSSSA